MKISTSRLDVIKRNAHMNLRDVQYKILHHFRTDI